MFVAGMYSHNGGIEAIEGNYPEIYKEVYNAVETCDTSLLKNKDATYDLNDYQNCIKNEFKKLGWAPYKQVLPVDLKPYYSDIKTCKNDEVSRALSLIKGRIGMNIEFERHHMVCHDINAPYTTFNNLNIIDYAIEITPMMEFAKRLNYKHDVLSFENYLMDLKLRGTADIDIPLLIFGVSE